MKISVEWFVDSILFSFFILIVFGSINIVSNINEAYNYHYYVVNSFEDSYYDTSILNDLTNQTNYQISYENLSTASSMSLYPIKQLYKITTSYQLRLPIINYVSTQKIVSYAR